MEDPSPDGSSGYGTLERRPREAPSDHTVQARQRRRAPWLPTLAGVGLVVFVAALVVRGAAPPRGERAVLAQSDATSAAAAERSHGSHASTSHNHEDDEERTAKKHEEHDHERAAEEGESEGSAQTSDGDDGDDNADDADASSCTVESVTVMTGDAANEPVVLWTRVTVALSATCVGDYDVSVEYKPSGATALAPLWAPAQTLRAARNGSFELYRLRPASKYHFKVCVRANSTAVGSGYDEVRRAVFTACPV